jgi:hypothetical protein
MSDLREELARKLFWIKWPFAEWEDNPSSHLLAYEEADRLLPFVQAQVDAALAAERSTKCSSIFQCSHLPVAVCPLPAGHPGPCKPTPALADGRRAVVDAAVKAERERCAKIAANWPAQHFDTIEDAKIADKIENGIAAAIREGEKP